MPGASESRYLNRRSEFIDCETLRGKARGLDPGTMRGTRCGSQCHVCCSALSSGVIGGPASHVRASHRSVVSTAANRQHKRCVLMKPLSQRSYPHTSRCVRMLWPPADAVRRCRFTPLIRTRGEENLTQAKPGWGLPEVRCVGSGRDFRFPAAAQLESARNFGIPRHRGRPPRSPSDGRPLLQSNSILVRWGTAAHKGYGKRSWESAQQFSLTQEP
jgi:hypothetical protein